MYKYEILLHGFGLAKQDLNFWNSNGDFRICSYVGYSNSIDEVLAGELEFSVLFTSTKKKNAWVERVWEAKISLVKMR